jgi:hypothetical protein
MLSYYPIPTTHRSHGPLTDGKKKPKNNMANGKKDVPIIQMHMLSFTKPLECNKKITNNVILEDVTPQPKEEMPWMSTPSMRSVSGKHIPLKRWQNSGKIINASIARNLDTVPMSVKRKLQTELNKDKEELLVNPPIAKDQLPRQLP